MKKYGTDPSREERGALSEIVSGLPGAELFSSLEQAQEVWPKEVAERPEFIEQVQERQQLRERLDVVLHALPTPDTHVLAAIESSELSEDQVAELFDSLSTLLGPDSEYYRAMLYLPFELLPISDWEPKTEGLQKSLETFRQVYLETWEASLLVHDVRANFVDGDVLEVEKREGDFDRVVKAAHLIPKLVEAGLLTVEDVVERTNSTTDPVLRQSLVDVLPVLRDMGYLDDGGPVYLRGETGVESKDWDVGGLDDRLADGFAEVDAKDYGDASDKRLWWLKKVGKAEVVDLEGRQIAVAIARGELREPEESHGFLEMSLPAQQAFIEGVRVALENQAKEDLVNAQETFGVYKDTLDALWTLDQTDLHGSLSKLFHRLNAIGVITDNQLSDKGIKRPELAGPFSENLKQHEAELAEVKRVALELERDPFLSKHVLPVVLAYGSRLKGYAHLESDIDTSVFIRPGVDPAEGPAIRAALHKLFGADVLGGETNEFWLDEGEEGELKIANPESYDKYRGENYWVNTLFISSWEGRKKEVEALRQKILTEYFYDDHPEQFGRDSRKVYFEGMERDLLQYRLMHDGYERFHPPYGGIDVPSAASIDGESTFYDSGYRHTAIQLFARQIFLPKLERESE
ncbi:MAG: hypothetical protein HQ488_02270 [Parcubacteria group bacterium]|nr:hypothetical protein [Parcubacteria group bacterium]